MGEDTQKRSRWFDWIFRMEGFALMLIVVYYLVVEHTAHLVEYAWLLTIFLFILVIVIVRFGMPKPEVK